jgi:hypothetical protein
MASLGSTHGAQARSASPNSSCAISAQNAAASSAAPIGNSTAKPIHELLATMVEANERMVMRSSSVAIPAPGLRPN